MWNVKLYLQKKSESHPQLISNQIRSKYYGKEEGVASCDAIWGEIFLRLKKQNTLLYAFRLVGI